MKDEETVPYPDGFPRWDEDTTVLVDPAEMMVSAQAMMFVDSGAFVLADIREKKESPQIVAAIAKPPAAVAKPPAIARQPTAPSAIVVAAIAKPPAAMVVAAIAKPSVAIAKPPPIPNRGTPKKKKQHAS